VENKTLRVKGSDKAKALLATLLEDLKHPPLCDPVDCKSFSGSAVTLSKLARSGRLAKSENADHVFCQAESMLKKATPALEQMARIAQGRLLFDNTLNQRLTRENRSTNRRVQRLYDLVRKYPGAVNVQLPWQLFRHSAAVKKLETALAQLPTPNPWTTAPARDLFVCVCGGQHDK
jgi:hypothetical protein